MEVIQKSRKRNHTSQPPSSTFTRSRAQSLLHRSRSGQIRHDPVRRKAEPHPVPVPVPTQDKLYHVPVHLAGNNATQEFSESEYKSLIQDICKEYCESDSEDKDLVKDLCKKAKLDDGDLACATAKDLRMRRVYSFLSSAGACSDRIGSALSNGSVVDSDREVAELGFQSQFADNGDALDDGRVSLTEVPVLGLTCEPRDFNRGNTESSCESPKLQVHKQIDEGNGGYCLEKIDDLGEEPVQTTPPDAVISINLEVNGDARKTEEALCVKDTPLAVNAGENSGKGFSGSKDCQLYSHVLKSKSILKPRLPGKLFKAPGSVNYRRLMEVMGDDFGILNSGHCLKDKKVMDAPGLEFPLLSDNREASKPETMTDSCTLLDTNGPKLTSSPMQLNTAKVNGECLSRPSVDGETVSDSKVDPAAGFLGARDVGNAKATNHNSCASEQLGVLNKDSIPTTHDAEIYDTSILNIDQTQSVAKDMCPKADKSNEPLKSKHARRPYLHGKLVKTPGSVNYRRLLPFLNNLTKDDSGTSKFGDQTQDVGLYSKELPLPSQSEEASIHMQMTVSVPMQDKVDSNASASNILVNPANMLTHGNLPELASSQDFSELPMQLDANETVQECLSESHVQAHSEKAAISSKDKCLSESKTDPCSVMRDFHCSKIVTNAANHDGPNQVHTTISEQHFSESQPKDQNLPNINDDIFSLPFKHHSSEEQGFTIGYDKSKELVNLEKLESVSSCPPQGQSLSQLDHNMLDVEENETSSHAISKTDDDVVLSCVSISKEPIQPSEKIISDKPELQDIAEEKETNSCAIRKFDDAVVLSCVNISNEEPRPPSQKIISDKPEIPDIAAHGGDTSGSLLNGLVYASKMPSKGSNNKNASSVREIENGSESKTTPVLNRCPRTKLFKHVGSFNYKRLLPIFLETVKSNSCASNNDHHPKVQKLLDHAPAVPISVSNFLVNRTSASNDCVPMDDSTCDSGAQKETELHTCDLNNDSSSPISQLPDKQIVSNGLDKLENFVSSPISVPRDLLTTPLRPIADEVDTREKEATPALSTEERSPETLGNYQSLSQLKVSDQVSAPTVGSQKGILRRNPRGCRGLCTCLNCASFRLHAERAFEFSRNQMLDADEVAQDLMKELSHLRNILESNINNDGVSDTPVFDGSQVKEACRKAFEIEQLAKDRLSQMNDDLNMHCRTPSLQPPSVKFSDHVEEKVIQPEA
ncbi:uncharacterized protein LOC131603453 [Vicia villosa]|uniref:uncharacterized protein LOC131603452 n=1 Tax=Vicia villosa TaxID=3911 RepID=UPI00273B4D41|nr:uncharacterized protein LOC131603452 [Vicia villosa]XP_058731748.1 uncharacterized protein LOC131603453 [Vicia villosa]